MKTLNKKDIHVNVNPLTRKTNSNELHDTLYHTISPQEYRNS